MMRNQDESFIKLFDYIAEHLDKAIVLEQLATLVNLSKFHFHRRFSALYGISIIEYLHKSKLRKAAYQLVFRDINVTDISLETGYSSLEAFSRSFKKEFGQSPRAFRKNQASVDWHYDNLYKELVMPKSETLYSVEVLNFTETRIAKLEHKGNPNKVLDTVKTFIDWRKTQKLNPKISRTFNILYEDPETASLEEYKIGLACSIKSPVEANTYNVIEDKIPAGKCAKICHIGRDIEMRSAIEFLYGEWLSKNNYQLRDFPLFIERISFFPDVAETEAITDIYLPIE